MALLQFARNMKIMIWFCLLGTSLLLTSVMISVMVSSMIPLYIFAIYQAVYFVLYVALVLKYAFSSKAILLSELRPELTDDSIPLDNFVSQSLHIIYWIGLYMLLSITIGIVSKSTDHQISIYELVSICISDIICVVTSVNMLLDIPINLIIKLHQPRSPHVQMVMASIQATQHLTDLQF